MLEKASDRLHDIELDYALEKTLKIFGVRKNISFLNSTIEYVVVLAFRKFYRSHFYILRLFADLGS